MNKDSLENLPKINLKEKRESFLIFLENIEKEYVVKVSNARVEEVVPKLAYGFHGKYVYVKKVKEYANFSKRPIKIVASYFAQKAGLAYSLLEDGFRLKGKGKNLPLEDIERRFYQEEVLCEKCRSPETSYEEKVVKCSNCGHIVKKEL